MEIAVSKMEIPVCFVDIFSHRSLIAYETPRSADTQLVDSGRCAIHIRFPIVTLNLQIHLFIADCSIRFLSVALGPHMGPVQVAEEYTPSIPSQGLNQGVVRARAWTPHIAKAGEACGCCEER